MKELFQWIWYTKIGKLVVLLPIAFTFLCLAENLEYQWMYIVAAIFGIIPVCILLAQLVYVFIVRPFNAIKNWFKNRKSK